MSTASGVSSSMPAPKFRVHATTALIARTSLLIAAAETAGLDDARYRADRKRDIALSRQAGIDAALALRAANDLKPADITAVTLGLPRAGLMLRLSAMSSVTC